LGADSPHFPNTQPGCPIRLRRTSHDFVIVFKGEVALKVPGNFVFGSPLARQSDRRPDFFSLEAAAALRNRDEPVGSGFPETCHASERRVPRARLQAKRR
jgi:hypothetical protein